MNRRTKNSYSSAHVRGSSFAPSTLVIAFLSLALGLFAVCAYKATPLVLLPGALALVLILLTLWIRKLSFV